MMLLGVYSLAALYLVCATLIMAMSPQRYLVNLAWLNLLTSAAALALAGLTTGIFINYDFYVEDFWTATEALNKARYGLLSSVDFYSPIGPFYYYVYGFMTYIDSTPTASTVMHAGALVAFLGIVLSVAMLWKHVSFLGLSIVLLSVVSVAVSGRGNGELLHQVALHFLAPYNRWAWALLIPVALRLSLPHKADPVGDIALGIAIALLLMIKVTYGAAALGLVVVRAVLIPPSWREILVLAAALVLVLGVVEFTTGQVTAHLRDLATTALLPESGLRPRKLFDQMGEMALFSLVGIVAYLATVETLPTQPRRPGAVWAFLRPIILMLAVAVSGNLVLMQNHYLTEAAVYPLLTLIVLEWTGALRRTTAHIVPTGFRRRVLITSATLFIVFYPVVDVGMHVGQRLQYRLNPPEPGFAGTPYADLKFEPYIVRNENSRLNTIPEGRSGVLAGLDMLRSAGAEDASRGTVATIAFSNPFPMLLGQSSPVGTPIWLAQGRTYSEEIYVSPDDFFRGVEFVLVTSESLSLKKIYRDTLASEFNEYSSNEYWTLFVRRK